jgi:hypothetical protein
MNTLSTMLTSLSEVDEGLLYPFEDVWQNTNILQASQLLYFVFYECFFCLQYMVWSEEHGSKNRNYISISCIIQGVVCVTEMQYFSLVVALKRRFSVLNSRLVSFPASHRTGFMIYDSGVKSRTQPRDDGNIWERRCRIGAQYTQDKARNYTSRGWQQKLHELRCFSDKLSDVVSSLNSMNGVQILLSITLIFIIVTTSLYFDIGFAVELREGAGSEAKHQSALILSLIWAAVGIFRIVIITLSCNAASSEADQTPVLLQKLLLEPSLHPDTVTETQLFLQQVTKRRIRFTASDFFTINHSTLCSFTGAVVTYLVILLQFQS